MISTHDSLATSLLPFPKSGQPQHYTIQTDTLSVLGNWQYENTSESHYQLTPLSDSIAARRVDIWRTNFTQTNRKGYNRLDEEVARLTDRLILDLAPNGQLVQVLNRTDLQARCRAVLPGLKQRYLNDPQLTPALIDSVGAILDEDERLVRVLANSPELSLLLPPVYNQAFSSESAEPMPGTRQIANVFSTLSIPLLTHTSWQAAPADGVAVGLRVEGWLDEAHYAFDDARQAMQALTAQRDIDPTPSVEYLESYEFDASHQLLYAGRLAIFGIPGVFMTKTVTTLRQDNPSSPQA